MQYQDIFHGIPFIRHRCHGVILSSRHEMAPKSFGRVVAREPYTSQDWIR